MFIIFWENTILKDKNYTIFAEQKENYNHNK